MSIVAPEYLLFFATATFIYYATALRHRWAILLIASCIFYMTYMPAYIFLLLFIISLNFGSAILMEQSNRRLRQVVFVLAITLNLSVLILFKYFNFFTENISLLANFLHWNYSVQILMVLVPVGLSFQIFQSLSYIFEVYSQRWEAEKHIGLYALFTLFYPTLLSGPIERPQTLLKQFHEMPSFEYSNATHGLKRMAWGYFKKVIVADHLAVVVNQVYATPGDYHGLVLIIATVLFAYQIYYDFSGYSDIVIGAAQVMGFKLTNNFTRPYFSASITEFWQRWHISLSTWIRDYMYYPTARSLLALTHRKHPRSIQLIVSIIVMGLVGLWHGANWTFVIWGLLHGFYLGLEGWFRAKHFAILSRLHLNQGVLNLFRVNLTFSCICFAWIFFRANSITDSIYVVTHLGQGINQPLIDIRRIFAMLSSRDWIVTICGVVTVEIADWLTSNKHRVTEMLELRPFWLRWAFYYTFILIIIVFGKFANSRFLYFQF